MHIFKTLYLILLFVSNQEIYANPGNRVVTADEIFAAIASLAEENIKYTPKKGLDSSTSKLNELTVSTCRTSFILDLALIILTNEAKQVQEKVDLETVRKRISNLNLQEMERDLKNSCEHISTAGKVRHIALGTLDIISSEPKSKRALAKYIERDKKKNAGLTQEIDLIGIIPGKSKKQDIDQIGVSHKELLCLPLCLEIGGYTLTCEPEYDEVEVLTRLTCWFGTKISNGQRSEVFQVLREGFTRKLGVPTLNQSDTVKTPLGVSFGRDILRWRDKQGNTLEILSINHRVDQGALALTSSLQNQRDQKEIETKSINRKF